ncbi:hypothetical protein AAMO2058_000503900 [Amorphochlora amoebiformis]
MGRCMAAGWRLRGMAIVLTVGICLVLSEKGIPRLSTEVLKDSDEDQQQFTRAMMGETKDTLGDIDVSGSGTKTKLWMRHSSGDWCEVDRNDFGSWGQKFPERYTVRCPICKRKGADSILLPCTHSVHFSCMPINNFHECPTCKETIVDELVVAFSRRPGRKAYRYKPRQWYKVVEIEDGEFPMLQRVRQISRHSNAHAQDKDLNAVVDDSEDNHGRSKRARRGHSDESYRNSASSPDT